jgi:hypothetical protein
MTKKIKSFKSLSEEIKEPTKPKVVKVKLGPSKGVLFRKKHGISLSRYKAMKKKDLNWLNSDCVTDDLYTAVTLYKKELKAQKKAQKKIQQKKHFDSVLFRKTNPKKTGAKAKGGDRKAKVNEVKEVKK